MDAPRLWRQSLVRHQPRRLLPLNASGTKQVQEVVGTLLYCAWAVDGTMLPALGTIATQQSAATRKTMSAVVRLLNYAATHPDAYLLYITSDMVLHVDSDASYLF
jgi:hypothetical protein